MGNITAWLPVRVFFCFPSIPVVLGNDTVSEEALLQERYLKRVVLAVEKAVREGSEERPFPRCVSSACVKSRLVHPRQVFLRSSYLYTGVVRRWQVFRAYEVLVYLLAELSLALWAGVNFFSVVVPCEEARSTGSTLPSDETGVTVALDISHSWEAHTVVRRTHARLTLVGSLVHGKEEASAYVRHACCTNKAGAKTTKAAFLPPLLRTRLDSTLPEPHPDQNLTHE